MSIERSGNTNKAFEELEDDHEAVLEMIKKCSKTAKQFYEEIS
jgi:hypothetical protein